MSDDPSTLVSLRDYFDKCLADERELRIQDMEAHVKANDAQFSSTEKATALAAKTWAADITEANRRNFATVDDLSKLADEVRLMRLWQENMNGKLTMLGTGITVLTVILNVGVTIVLKAIFK